MSSSRAHIDIKNKYDRVVVLVDMDCFYCQVEEKLNPNLKGKAIAVVQYNAWQGGGIIAVNYPAKAQGVTRHMRGNQAKEQCPEIELVSVPSVREKADLTKYREAGKSVADVLQKFTPLLERASVDEAYLDITEQVTSRINDINEGSYKIQPINLFNTYAVGYEIFGNFITEILSNYRREYNIEEELEDFDYEENDLPAIKNSSLKLLIGATIANEIRTKVKEVTGYDCSAGIAHNKILAKLACGLNKPNKQTVFPLKNIPKLFSDLPLGKIKGLGGKFGEEVCESLKIKHLGELTQFDENDLKSKFDEKSGTWLYLISRGIDLEAVTPRFSSKSIGCCKKFPGRNSINGVKTLNHWLNELATEIGERLEKDIIENNRKAKQMVVSFIQEIKSTDVSSSRSAILPSYEPDIIAKVALDILRNNTEQFLKNNNDNILNNPIKFLGISVGKFDPLQSEKNPLKDMFMRQHQKNTENNLKKSPSKTQKDIERKTDDKAIDDIVETPNNVETDNSNRINDPGIKSYFLQAFKKRTRKESEDEEIITELRDSEPKERNPLPSTSVEINKCQSSENENTKLDEIISEAIEIQDENKPEYIKTYAEFMRPEINDNDYVTCTQCKQKVITFNLQIHLDGHLAFELSQQQRIEYRNELKNSQTPPSKKQKPNNISRTSSSHEKKPQFGNIEKFLRKCENVNLDSQNMYKCLECNCFVDNSKRNEHEDHHYAQKIQREWNSLPVSSD